MDLSKLQLGKLKELYDKNNADSDRLELDISRSMTKDKKCRARICHLSEEIFNQSFDIDFLPYTLAQIEYSIEMAIGNYEYDRKVKTSLKARFNVPEHAFKGGKPEWKQGRGKNKDEDDGNDWANRKRGYLPLVFIAFQYVVNLTFEVLNL